MKTVVYVITLILLLSACEPQLVSIPTSTSTPVPILLGMATKTPTQTPQPSPTPYTFQPTIPPISESALISAINPPEFAIADGENLELSESGSDDLVFGEIYKAFRWIEGLEETSVNFKDQADYHKKMADFLKSHPELTVKQQQSPDKASILTYIVKKTGDVSSVLFGFKDGVLAFAEPNVADAETKLGEVVIPDGLTPEFVYNPADGHWYLFAVSKGGEPYYWFKTDGAAIDNLDLQWQTYTEFEGEYPEGFELKEKSLKTIILTEPTTGMQIPMRIGLEKDMPFEEYEPTEEGKKLLVDYYLTACWSRYTIIEGHQIDKASFIQAVAAGKIRLRVPYVDMRTGKKKVGLNNPKDGFTTVFVFDKELPLQQTPKSNSKDYKVYYDNALNNQGFPILTLNLSDKGYQEAWNQDVASGQESVKYFLGDIVYGLNKRIIGIFSGLTLKNLLENDGLVKNPDGSVMYEVIENHEALLTKLDKHADHPYILIK